MNVEKLRMGRKECSRLREIIEENSDANNIIEIIDKEFSIKIIPHFEIPAKTMQKTNEDGFILRREKYENR